MNSGVLGGTSDEHKEGISEGCASFHMAGQPRHGSTSLARGGIFGAESKTSAEREGEGGVFAREGIDHSQSRQLRH